MKTKKHLEISQRISDLTQKAQTSAMSVKWWEDEMESIIKQIDNLETNPDEDSEYKISQLIERLAVLVPRAKIEIEIIDKMEQELKDILNEKQIKNKKSPRKKTI